MSELSTAGVIATRLVSCLGREQAVRALDLVLGQMSTADIGVLAYDWRFWARPKQMIDPLADWRWWGFLAGRGFGKSYAVSQFVNQEIEAGRAKQIGLAAQDEENSIGLQVLGPSGLIATAPPWNKPEWRASAKQLHWPNGAIGIVRTPEVPGKIRGWEYDLTWLTEFQSWPTGSMLEALSNFEISTRIGLARTVWDATPKRRHPILKQLIADYERDPLRFRIVRGSTHENAINLGNNYVEDLERKYGGTQKGREELLGEMLDDSESAIAKQAWIDLARRPAPSSYARTAIGVDPAITTKRSSDRTGIIRAGLGHDGQAYVTGDLSGKHQAEKWAGIVLDDYLEKRIDVVVVETNKGGDLVTSNLRAGATSRSLNVVVVGEKERPRHQRGVVFVKEVHARGPKEDRAQPMSTAYERGRVSHVIGVDLSTLEETLTTWEPTPGARSPDDLDALTHVIVELLDLKEHDADNRAGFRGITKAAKLLDGATERDAVDDPQAKSAASIARHLHHGGRGGRI
jgi:phage terminase large subunit-like protein